jgi:hypothetical protein
MMMVVAVVVCRSVVLRDDHCCDVVGGRSREAEQARLWLDAACFLYLVVAACTLV